MSRDELVREIESLRARMAALGSGCVGGPDAVYHDPVTGLYDRGAFFTLTLQQVRLAARRQRPMLLLACDVPELEQVTETHGPEAGDSLLARTARLLRRTYREADIVARLGDGLFAVLAVDASGEHEHLLVGRLRTALAAEAERSPELPELIMRVGGARWEPEDPCSVKDLLDRAEGNMRQDAGT